MKRRLTLFAAALVFAGAAYAQTAPDAGDAANPARPKAATDKRPKGAASLLDRTLRLNGASGEMQLAKSDDGKSLRIVKLTLSGEVISDPAQKCEISIVGEAPIEAVAKGVPNGLPRYDADIPVCPLSFFALNQAIYFAPQPNACVFQAADCQANPSGIWGPGADELAKQTKALTKDLSRAETSISANLRTLNKRNKDGASALEKEENDFAATRDDTCARYEGEASHAFCHTRFTEAHAAQLRTRVAKEKDKKNDDSSSSD